MAGTALGIACLVLLATGAWNLGLLDVRALRALRLPGVESGFQVAASRRDTEPPRVLSAEFGATCASPAPVYVQRATETPAAFLVIIAKPVTEPERAADSLARRYRLTTRGYEAARRGFVASLDPPTIAKLRCEPAVRMLEENPAGRDSVIAPEP